MDIPVFVEPTASGARATLAGPWNITAEAKTADQAVIAVRLELQRRLEAGAKVVSIAVDDPLMQSVARISSNPMRAEWREATLQARRQIEAEEEAREREEDAARNGHTNPAAAPTPADAPA